MDIDEFKSFMYEEDLGDYIDLFIREKLIGETVLASLTNEELAQIGVSKLGDRKRMLEAFNSFKPPKAEPEIKIQEPLYTPQATVPEVEKKSGGVWAVVGVLLAILLVIAILGSL